MKAGGNSLLVKREGLDKMESINNIIVQREKIVIQINN